jgi:hypothetical protein
MSITTPYKNIITELFSDCFDHGVIEEKTGKERRLQILIDFIDKPGQNFPEDIFCGDRISIQKFVLACYRDKLLPVDVFGKLLRYFVIRKAGGLLYSEWRAQLFAMIEYCGPSNIMTEADYSEYQNLPDVVSIFRGGHYNNLDCLFWSLKKSIAEKYVSLGGLAPHLLTGTISKEHILLLVDKGQEIVCRYNDINNIEIIGYLNQNGVLVDMTDNKKIGTL